MSDRLVEPFTVAQMVETYVDSETRDSDKYSNRTPQSIHTARGER